MTVIETFSTLQPQDGFLDQLWRFVNGSPVLVLLIVAFAIGYAVRRARQVKPGPVVPESIPPDGITPAESGMLLYDHIGPREVAATLIDLAVRKYLQIEDATPQMGGPLVAHDLVFRLLKPEGDWQNLAPHEKTLLRQSFQSENRARFSQLRLRIPEIVSAMQAQIENSIWEKGIYREDPNKRGVPSWKAALYFVNGLVLVDAIVLRLIPGDLVFPPELLFMVIALLSAIVIWAARTQKFSTEKGTRTWTHLLGLRQFIEAVDSDRLQRLVRYRFDELLPYAIVFRFEERWARAFRELGVQHVEWIGNDENDSLLRGNRLTFLSAYLQPLGSKK